MGAATSQESDSAAPTPADHFDISEIVDDRESAEGDAPPDTNPGPESPTYTAENLDENADMARRTDIPWRPEPIQTQQQIRKRQGRKKNGKRKAKGSPSTTSKDTSDEVLTRVSLPTDKSPDVTEDAQPLRETEPELYHDYVMSDQSDVEDEDSPTQISGTNGFTAVNRSSQQIVAEVSDAGTADTDSEEGVSAPQVLSPESEDVVKSLLLVSAATHSNVEITASQAGTKVPQPKVNSDGRFSCPFRDIDGCPETFVTRQGAIKHTKRTIRHKTSGEADAQFTIAAPMTAVQAMVAPKSTPATRTEIPVPQINRRGQIPCPFAEEEKCEKVFKDEKSATQHARIHTNAFACFVCKKRLSRKDKLVSHMKIHSGSEIAAATQQEQEEEEQNLSEETVHEAQAEVGESEEEGSSEYATPDNTLLEATESSSAEKVLRGAQDLVDADMTEAEPVHDVSDEVSEMIEAEPVEDALDEVSEQRSHAPPSVFYEEETVVRETPVHTGQLKRKRAKEAIPEAARSSPKNTRKRRRVSPSPMPTSMPSNDVSRLETPKSSTVIAAARNRQITDKIIPRLQSRQGSMEGWAQKYTPGSNLRHPTLNPTPPRPGTQRIEVNIPRMSQAGTSAVKSKWKKITTGDGVMDINHEDTEANSRNDFKRKKLQQATYATPKGKKRAEPGVDYSTPTKGAPTDEPDTSDDEETSPVNIATSVAKRTFHRQNAEEMQAQEGTEDSDSDVNRDPESDPESSEAERPARKKSTSGTKRILKPKTAKKSEKAARADPADRVECGRCHRFFTSLQHLRAHQKKKSAHVGLFKCHDCSEEFWATAALARHEQDTGHGKGDGLQGRVGAFSQGEVDKINRWRDQFCDYHDISETEFNYMMTATLERGKGARWNYSFVKRQEFLKEFLGVLPNRNKRSMLRYRERNFQNLEGMKNWTAEDDKELIRLQKQLGPKWAEIGRRLGRTFDAVSQRWRHKLQYSHVQTGEWSEAEDIKFTKIMAELQHDADGNELEDHQILWTKVSEKLGTRSAQQCSNHYRALYTKKRRGRYVKNGASGKAAEFSRVVTPSKMELRLSGNKGIKGNRRQSENGLSEAYIRDDDDEDDEVEAAEDEEAEDDEPRDQGSAKQERRIQADNEDEAESRSSSDEQDDSAQPTRGPNPLTAKTPGRTLGSSQLFEQTQANTSALKPSQHSTKKGRGHLSQDRPSPNIPIQRQHVSLRSPLAELCDLDDVDKLVHEDEDQLEEEGVETGRQKTSQELSTVSARRDDDEFEEDEDNDEHEQGTSPEESTDEEGVKTESNSGSGEIDSEAEASEGEDAPKSESDADEELVDEEASEDVTATDDEETKSADQDGTESTDGTETVSESEADDEDEALAVQAKGPTASFMDSINNSAKRANIKKVRSGSQTQTQTLMGLPIPKSGHRRDIWQQASEESD